MGETVLYRNDLSRNLEDFWGFMSGKVYAFGETWALAINKSTLAEKYGKSLRTVQRYLNDLEDLDYISTATKAGKGGGTVIVFNKDMLDFDPTVNPITDTTLSTEEIIEKLYPSKPKKKPKKKYRSKAEIAEERLRRRRRNGDMERLNDILEDIGYPTKEFWQETPDPEKYYKAYLISRMYNFYAVYYPEKIKNESEAQNNYFRFHLGELIQNKYNDFDVLPTRFMGTSNYTIALKMVEIFDELDVNPAAYLTVQFNYMEFLLNNGKNARLPYFNALISEHAAKRWDDTYAYKTGFRKEHPYYTISPDEVVDVVGYSVPHMTMLVSEYKKPFTQSGYKDYLDVAVDPLVAPKRIRVIYSYYKEISERINANENLSEDERTALSTWVMQQTAIHLASRYPNHAYLIASLDQIVHKAAAFDEDNFRKLYYQLGSYTLDQAVDQIELKTRIKNGYFLHFSVFGSSSFYNAMRATRSARGTEIDQKALASAIEKFGARKIPINTYGDLDVHEIALKQMTEQEIKQESFNNAQQIKGKQKFLDFFDGMWYDIREDYVTQSPRDGRKVIK